MWRILLTAIIMTFATIGCTFFGFLVDDNSREMVTTNTIDAFSLTATGIVRDATLNANTPQTHGSTLDSSEFFIESMTQSALTPVDPFNITRTTPIDYYNATASASTINTTPDYGATATELVLGIERTLAPFRTATAEYFLTQDMTPTFEAIPYR